MEKEFYAILFRAGSSGRFIANLVWGSIYPNKYSFTTSDYNSTHVQTPWSTTFEFKTERSIHIWRDKKLFDRIELLTYPAMITAHLEVKFDDFFTKFPFGKIIMITLNEDDFFEVNSNSLLKNGFENFTSQRMDYPDKIYIVNKYKEKFGVNPVGKNFSDEFKKEILMPYFDSVNRYRVDKSFSNVEVPEQYQSKVLLLPYSEIVNDKKLTLDNISNFINRNIPSNVIQFYDEYIDGRNQLVEKYMT
jgi:hypothetical protein